MRLNQVQGQLERLYDVRSRHRVEDFLLQQRTAWCNTAADAPETLLVRQHEDGLDIGLYLDQALLERLLRDSPAQQLHDGNLEDYLAAVEGVSHFLYLVWNAHHGRSVTQLEMELQAEVDKFVSAAYWISRQYGAQALNSLHPALFSGYRLRDGLNPEQRQRYLRASRLAARYCRSLPPNERRPIMAELRRFYRMPQGRKIRHIQTL